MKIEKQSQSVFFVGEARYMGSLSYVKRVNADTAEAAIGTYLSDRRADEYAPATSKGTDFFVYETTEVTQYTVTEADPEVEVTDTEDTEEVANA